MEITRFHSVICYITCLTNETAEKLNVSRQKNQW